MPDVTTPRTWDEFVKLIAKRHFGADATRNEEQPLEHWYRKYASESIADCVNSAYCESFQSHLDDCLAARQNQSVTARERLVQAAMIAGRSRNNKRREVNGNKWDSFADFPKLRAMEGFLPYLVLGEFDIREFGPELDQVVDRAVPLFLLAGHNGLYGSSKAAEPPAAALLGLVFYFYETATPELIAHLFTQNFVELRLELMSIVTNMTRHDRSRYGTVLESHKTDVYEIVARWLPPVAMAWRTVETDVFRGVQEGLEQMFFVS